MRAGSDIGYCDSDYRANNTVENFVYTENDIKANLESLGFELVDITFCDFTIDLYIKDKKTGKEYDFYDLRYDEYEYFIRKDFLNNYDEIFTKKDLEI
tara:strand:+ start:2051 stop:2344 length:294 start_codon:yes stop_codon:yes gene_type:complete